MKQEFDSSVMEKAVDEAVRTSSQGIGGPFGAAIVRGDEVVVASNTVLESHDPTAHAEVNVIRKASEKFGTHDLFDCVLYATSQPCPMCQSAIIWANIKKIYYGNTAKDTSKIGFRDDFMYTYFKEGAKDKSILDSERVHSESCTNLLTSYANENRELY